MLPWRPLGMLACGLTVIFLFIILHGNGYDFPVVIARCSDEIDYWTLPDKTYLEISGVHDFTQDVASAAVTNTKEESKHFLKRNKPAFMNQWHLGSKSTTQQEKADKSPNNEKMKRGAAAGKEGEKDDEEQWIWMTNIWHEISECGPGYLRQYRRRLSDALKSDKSAPWELMYAHRFPGPIIHSSLSRRPLPKEADSKRDRESIRLAVVYKLVEEERVTYHSRVYHFGTFQRNGPELKEECQISVKETCHVHVPFLSFDYILPGSTPIKDFSLEHDTFLYSRLGDTVLFRSLKLPQLKPDVTSPSNPYSLLSGAQGPSSTCEEKRNVPYRMSYLATIPSISPSEDLHVLMGQVQEYRRTWKYQATIATESTDLKTGNKKWLLGKPWLALEYDSLVQENDMINDEPHTYGVSIQKPYLMHSLDRTSVHIPIKNTVLTLETQRVRVLQKQSDRTRREAEALKDASPIAINTQPQKRDQEQIIVSSQSQRQKLNEHHEPTSSEEIYKDELQWVDYESRINAGTLDSTDTEYGVISDKADILALKTTQNAILILRRELDTILMRGIGPWGLRMVMHDREYNALDRSREMAKRDMLVMKVVTVPVPIYEDSDHSLSFDGDEGEGVEGVGKGAETSDNTNKGSHGVPSSAQTPESSEMEEKRALKPKKTELHNVLVSVYGSGKLFIHDLDRATETKMMIMFIEEKYPVVIGMLAVVIAFVINETR